MVCKGPPLHILVISIPSNGSIQFLQIFSQILVMPELLQSQSPQTGQFNSYAEIVSDRGNILLTSQSPQTGQFNSYYLLEILQVLRDRSQSPQTGQFNSYYLLEILQVLRDRSQSPQTGQFNSYSKEGFLFLLR